MAIEFSIKIDGVDDTTNSLSKLIGKLEDDHTPYKQSSVVIYSSVMKNFTEQGRPEKWKGLSLFTMFVKSHRKSQKRTNPMILQDSGRLKGSITPFYDSSISTFGVKTNIPYAGLMNFGGKSQPNSVLIGSYYRRSPSYENQFRMAFGKRTKHTGMVKVKPYVMNIKGGHEIPSRPFMVLQKEDYNTISSIFSDWLKGVSNG